MNTCPSHERGEKRKRNEIKKMKKYLKKYIKLKKKKKKKLQWYLDRYGRCYKCGDAEELGEEKSPGKPM